MMKLRIGTRGSALALAQTASVEELLYKNIPNIEIERVVITTKGDRVQNVPLAQLGGGGVFAGEIENALLTNQIDLAVHSAKDLPAALPDDLDTVLVPEREDPREVLIIGDENAPYGRVGTGSIRRRAGFLRLHSEAAFEDIRGNIDTRLKKLYAGQYSSIILAAAGLKRLGLLDKIGQKTLYPVGEFVPAPCQGIIAVEGRKGELNGLLSTSDHPQTRYAFRAEREVLRLLGGSCSVPVGAYCQCPGDGSARMVYTKDGTKIYTVTGGADPLELAKKAVEGL